MKKELADIAADITVASGQPFNPVEAHRVSGGSIHQAWLLADGRQRYFVKINAAETLPMFEAEMLGLATLREGGAVRVPDVAAIGLVGNCAFLAIEAFELRGLDQASGVALGHGLAALHRNSAQRFGWQADNFIGSMPQHNVWTQSWPRFWTEKRLLPQLRWAAQRGLDQRLLAQGHRLAEDVDAFFLTGQPQPSLLHGDLWSGNASALADATPVIYDPAVYFGDREADLAMTELFGGFPESFYAAYREAWPLPPEYETRKMLYNLYHLLNHFNLFGAGYLSQVQRMIGRLTAVL